ncbi:YveK family protein [Clostridium sediminicola]|uniref:YveK family protein n=1 Tax=Clostridium sediminicola TaxID=3114879 RepID=UPI0031F232A0
MEEEISLDLRELFFILRKRITLIVSITLLATVISALVSVFVLTPIYEAKMSVVIGKATDINEELSYNLNDVNMYQKLVSTYAVIAKSKVVSEKAVNLMDTDLTADKVREMLAVTPQNNTQIVDLKVQSKDPEEAKEIVSKITIAFINRAEKLIPNGNIEVLDKAELPKNPIKPNKTLNVAITFILGLMVSVGIVFILEYMDNTVKTKEDIEKYVGLPVIGIIPEHVAE